MTSFNKTDTFDLLKNSYFARKSVSGRMFAVFLGDSKTDPDTMRDVEGVEHCIFIGFILPHRMGEISVFLEKYDVVIATKNASLEFVIGLLNALISGGEKEAAKDDDSVNELKGAQLRDDKDTFTHSFS